MSNYWRNQFEKPFLSTGTRLRLDEILQEAHDVYWGSLGALLIKFKGELDKAELESMDKELNGESAVRMAANDCYDYAINGRLSLAKDGVEETRMNDNWTRLATLVCSARLDIEVYSPEINGREMALPKGLEHLLLHALVRARLDLDTHPKIDEDALPQLLRQDNTGYLTLKEIALLGQMSERAVRNAAQPTAADRLQTRKEQSQTVVDATEALRWLKGRRGFIATRAD